MLVLLLVAYIFNLAIDQRPVLELPSWTSKNNTTLEYIEHKDACYNNTLLSLDWRFEFKANPSLATLLSSCVLSLTFDTNEKEDSVETIISFSQPCLDD